LQFARIIYRRADYAEIAISDQRVRSLELRMIKDIEGFGAKLETYTLITTGQSEIFEEIRPCLQRLAGRWRTLVMVRGALPKVNGAMVAVSCNTPVLSPTVVSKLALEK
jgi:hypothetical protein